MGFIPENEVKAKPLRFTQPIQFDQDDDFEENLPMDLKIPNLKTTKAKALPGLTPMHISDPLRHYEKPKKTEEAQQC